MGDLVDPICHLPRHRVVDNNTQWMDAVRPVQPVVPVSQQTVGRPKGPEWLEGTQKSARWLVADEISSMRLRSFSSTGQAK